ncbi:MAG: SET domain-containing protein [Proteobacteria bacterium]|nr:SET domain-containing protein [Pseudomonadota bacterium]
MHHKLDYRITHRYSGLDISASEIKRLFDIASWNGVVPRFARPGRVAWHALEEEVSLLADPRLRFVAAKLKGVGLWNPKLPGRYSGKLHDVYSNEPVPPLSTVWEDLLTYPHMGITDGGEYTFAYSAPCPIGGILHNRAHLEYCAAERLIENGVPTIAPLAVIEYGQSLQFEGRPMGAVITLSPELSWYRVSEILYGAALNRGSNPEVDDYYDAMRVSLGIDGDPDDERTRLRVIGALARQEGKLVHDFSMAGLYRYSADWSNFHYSVERGEVFLIDLDSVQDMDSITEPLRAMQAWRDLSTAIYRMVAKIGYPTALDKYTLNNLLDHDPVIELLSGYFPEIPVDEFRPISRRLWNYFIPHLFLLRKHREAIRRDWCRERRKSYKMDHDIFYIMTLTSLQPLFATSDIGKRYPSELDAGDMWAKAERYLGDRFEYFAYLMGETNPKVG